ncbi:MAG TPA: sugar kinase [Chitinophagaceae bacterium]|nr:sugar kinase [Chitinophagaceae bacterium]
MAEEFKNNETGAVLCFGEVMLRLSPPADTSWLSQHQVQVNLAGAECNVAAALAKWGMRVKYCTALPGNNISASVLRFLEDKGIDVSAVKLCGSRIGLYYIEHGTDLKHGGVIYDRKYSSFGELQQGMIDWGAALKGVNWFHFSAINPALNENVTAVCDEALQAAKQQGSIISVDLNYRAKLWQYGKKPVEVMPALAGYCDVIMGNLWSANTLLGIELDEAFIGVNTKESYLQHAEKTAKAIQQKFPACKTVALTFRLDEPGGNLLYYGVLYHNGNLYVSNSFTSPRIVDKVGSGDCFMAGLIYGLKNHWPPAHVTEYASAAAFGKLHERGDLTNHSINDIHKIIKHNAYCF